ncbi:hypothetical protein PseBG33_2003 [Pseudomonas synxantha BG33R]|uniref:DUF4174 domain-containing protein n=1 Tax=Pseudomonas TaxID=286 RepID=UPI00025FF7ED|nr:MULTISPECIES: DUF4174 domain-containing protein [Pseudomonas]EIK67238.1 hypothetical protein PseBG33_2003 [Pseudomonas synxantha BG33R]QOY74126.1 DUF4174 domain-containing protein [Pseudomonas sp. OST1909]WPN52150.1 DUF4174 domain-containing protein [Pseudomonas sp. P9_2]
MLIRSLTLATLMAFTGPLLAADDNPLKQELGKTRPLVVVELDAGNPTLATLKKQLEEAATKQSFEERSMVFYTVKFGSIGAEGEKFAKDPKDSKKLTPPETNALIRALKLGVGSGTKVILIGKDGEKKVEKTVPPDTLDLKEFFSTIDQMPMAEKEAAAPVVPEPAPAPGKNATKAGKATKPAAPQQLDD